MSLNIPLLFTYSLSIIIMIGLPITLAVIFTRLFKVSWWVVLAGVLTFIASQALRIPATLGVNALFSKGILTVAADNWIPVVYAVIAGLMAGVFEETARWVGFKVLKDKVEKFGSSLALGAGHGGFESILLCVLGTAFTLFAHLFYNPASQLAKGVSTDQVQYMMATIQQFWAVPWHYGLLPGVERVIALSTQILLSILVWKAVVDRSFIWFALAVLYHMIVDAVAAFLQQMGWSYWAIEGILAIFMLINFYLIYRFWKDEKEIEKEMDEITDEELAEEEDEEDDEDDEDDDVDDDEEDDETEQDVDER